jgi:hypothetical protein
MEPDLDPLAAYCFLQGWSIEIVGDHTLVIERPGSRANLICTAALPPGYFVLRSRCPVAVAHSKRMLAAEFATRVNRRLAFGALYLDLATGEIGMRTVIPVEEGHLCRALIDRVVRLHYAAVDQWFPGVAAVCFGDVAPLAAIDQCDDSCSIEDALDFASRLLDLDADVS